MTTNHFKQNPIRVGLISLGCAKNLVDAEVMLGSLLRDGFEITNDAANADVVIVNTCSFIDAAKEESVDAILESAALREARNRNQGLVVSGCLSQRFRDELPKLLPEVDAFMGIDQVSQVSEIVQRALTRRADRLRELTSPAGNNPSTLECASLPALSRRDSNGGRVPRNGPEQPSRNQMAERELRTTGSAQLPLRAKTFAEESSRKSKILTYGNTGVPQSTGVMVHPQGSETKATSPVPFVAVNTRPKYIPDYATARFRLTPPHVAYVKIAEGCNHPCSFCTIPRMRGSHRSRAQGDIVEEARRLIAEGVKELNLISQDSTYYGLDLRPNRSGSIASPEKFSAAARALPSEATTLCTLLRALNDLPGEFWVRLLYTHPAHWTEELIQTMAQCPKVARYVDLPLQHIHDNMLERMRRETSQQYIIDLIAKIRAGVPGIAVRTTFIVGFPGETEAHFQTLVKFIRETKFERLGIFTYSREEGTRASQMMNQIPGRVKERRRQQAMAEQLEVARQISESSVGREIKVLVERKAQAKELQHANVSSWEHGLVRSSHNTADVLKGRYVVARGEADAPDIDGRVYVRGILPAGEFARVRVVGHTDYDLIAEPL